MPLKVLDYGRPNPFGETIGKPRNLAWPVNAYRVTLPKVSEDGESLNPFERLILKMIDVGSVREAESLARETCIPVDLVQCVLLRLRDKNFIDEYNLIITQNRVNWENKEDNPADYVTALLFCERATGKTMPFLHLLNDKHPLKKNEKEERYFRLIRCVDDCKTCPPKERDVIIALRTMKKRSMAFGGETRLPKVCQVTIASEPEQYYLDCPIAIQKNDGEFRIADPFGIGFSLVLENAFSRLLEQDNNLSDWLKYWKQTLSKTRQDTQARTNKEPYDNDVNQGRYPNLVSNLSLEKNARYRSLLQIYAVLEWALFHTCAKRPFETAVNQLRLTNQSEHTLLLNAAAEKVGLQTPQHGFRPVLEGKLDDFLSGKAEMGTVLSIALLMAESDAAHPLRRIAAKYQDLIIRIFDLKKRRDAQRHGHGKVQTLESKLPEEDFICDIITMLLPSIRFSDAPAIETDKDDIADLLLDARSSVQSEFGFKHFNRLGADLQDCLIHAECFWLSYSDGDDALPFACDIYASLQKTFRRKFFGILPPDIKDSEFSVIAQNTTIKSGFGQLPEVLRTVKPTAIRNTLQGNDQTLGACVVAFLLISDTDTLHSVADIQRSFITDVSDIIKRCGHGNEPLPLSKTDIGNLRKVTYRTIKTLLEV